MRLLHVNKFVLINIDLNETETSKDSNELCLRISQTGKILYFLLAVNKSLHLMLSFFEQYMHGC